MFYEGHYLEQAEAGKVAVEWLPGGTSDPAANQPLGTVSQMGYITDLDGNVLARLNRYLRPDGSSTPPDPKWLRVGTVAHVPKHRDHETCSACPRP